MRVNEWLGKSIRTVQQVECPKITASNLISSKSVRRLLALLMVLQLHDGHQWKQNVGASEHAVDRVGNLSRGSL